MKKEISEFGRLFIESVRDNTLFVLEGIISGHMKSQIDKEMHEKVNTLSNQDLDLLKKVSYRMIDLSLHNMLVMFEDNQQWVISSSDDHGLDLKEVSDGLAGELYTSDGWIKQFSEYPPSEGL